MRPRPPSPPPRPSTVGQRWVMTRRLADAASRRRPGLAAAHVPGGPLVLGGVGGLAQHQVEAGAELLQRPRRARVGRVAEGPTGPVEADGQGLLGVVGPVEGERGLADPGPVAVGDRPASRAWACAPDPARSATRGGCVDRAAVPPSAAPEPGLGVHGEQVGPVVGVVVGDDHGVDLGRVDQGLEDGEGARSGVEHHDGVRHPDQVAAAGAAGPGPAAVAAEDGERHLVAGVGRRRRVPGRRSVGIGSGYAQRADDPCPSGGDRSPRRGPRPGLRGPVRPVRSR